LVDVKASSSQATVLVLVNQFTVSAEDFQQVQTTCGRASYDVDVPQDQQQTKWRTSGNQTPNSGGADATVHGSAL
jgi:hypothetical protein